MKKFLLTLVVVFAFGGLIFAQNGVDGDYPSHWSDFYSPDFEMQGALTAFIQIDGEWISAEEDWHAFEVGFFILKSDGTEECRGHDFLFEPEAGWIEIPYLNASPVYYTEPGDAVFFKLYNHVTEVEYDYLGSNIEVLTGEDHWEVYDYDEIVYTNGVNLYFATPGGAPTFVKEIVGYGDSDGGYYLIATPVDDVNPAEVAGMLDNAYDLYYFDQNGDDAGNEWFNYKANAFNLTLGKGYLYANSQDVTLTFTGQPYLDNFFDLPLTWNPDAPLAGWNLIGNPFTEAANVDHDLYVMNEGGTEIIAATENTLAPMEGAFVIATDEEQFVGFYKDEPTGEKGAIAVLNLSKERGIIDRTIIRFDNERMLPKFQINGNNTKIYIPQDNKDYAIVAADRIGVMPVCFEAATDGVYTISFNAENIDFSYMHLFDNITGADIDLLETPNYSFEAQTSDYALRFKLVYTVTTTGVNEDYAFVSDGNLIVNGEGTLRIIDVTGRIVRNEQVNNSNNTIKMSAGVYVLQLINGSDVKTQKIVVK